MTGTVSSSSAADSSRGDIVPCWSCKGPVAARALFCHTCGVVQPPRALDHFTRLGLRPDFALSPPELERHYFGYQKALHPDRFATRSPRERAHSQAQAAALNEAYETLRQPLPRAAYLLGLKGEKLPDDGRTISDPALLAAAMEDREALAEAGDVAAVDLLARRSASIFADGLKDLAAAFARNDLAAARTQVLRLRYLEKFLEDAKARRRQLERDAG